MKTLIIIGILLFTIYLKIDLESKLRIERAKRSDRIDTIRVPDYLCLIGGDWVRCDPDKMASEEPAKD